MSVKMYLSTWAVFAFACFLALVTGNLTIVNAVILGFVFSTLIFMGMINVIPIYVAHPTEPKQIEPLPEAKPVVVSETPAKAFHVFKSA